MDEYIIDYWHEGKLNTKYIRSWSAYEAVEELLEELGDPPLVSIKEISMKVGYDWRIVKNY